MPYFENVIEISDSPQRKISFSKAVLMSLRCGTVIEQHKANLRCETNVFAVFIDSCSSYYKIFVF